MTRGAVMAEEDAYPVRRAMGASVIDSEGLLRSDPTTDQVLAHVLDVADRLLSLEDAERVKVRVERDREGPRIVITGPTELVDLLEAELSVAG